VSVQIVSISRPPFPNTLSTYDENNVMVVVCTLAFVVVGFGLELLQDQGLLVSTKSKVISMCGENQVQSWLTAPSVEPVPAAAALVSPRENQ
jgi:hypothetical protein